MASLYCCTRFEEHPIEIPIHQAEYDLIAMLNDLEV